MLLASYSTSSKDTHRLQSSKETSQNSAQDRSEYTAAEQVSRALLIVGASLYGVQGKEELVC